MHIAGKIPAACSPRPTFCRAPHPPVGDRHASLAIALGPIIVLVGLVTVLAGLVVTIA